MSQQDSTTLWNKIWAGRRLLELKGVQAHLLQGSKMRERWAKANHKAIYGEAEDCNVADEDMGDITLGDRITHHHRQTNHLLTAAAAAAMLMGGGGLAAIPFAMMQSRQSPPQETAVIERVERQVERQQVEVLEPIITQPATD